MSRTVELGRAVLDSTHLQLWFSTSITVSPQQDSINFQQLNQRAVLDFLLSGNTWVSRGHGMNIVLELTANEEFLGRREVGALAEQIVNAPVWRQLELSPSLHVDEPRDNSVPYDDGRLQISIKHTRKYIDVEAKKGHRIFSNVPFADITPPEGVQSFGILSVRFAMDFIKIQCPLKPIKPRFRKKSDRIDSSKFDIEGAVCLPLGAGAMSGLENIDNDDDDEILSRDKHVMLRTGHEGDGVLPQILDLDLNKCKRPSTLSDTKTGPNTLPIELICNANKRKRLSTRPDTKISLGVPSVMLYNNDKTWKRSGIVPDSGMTLSESPFSAEFPGLETLVDAAMHLAVCNSLPKPASGVKAKASTFTGSLANIAPALWSPGYLSTFSQRSHFIPIISRSLGRAGSIRAKSLSLRDKISRLTACSASDGSTPLHPDRVNNNDEREDVKCLSAQLWIHTQRNMPMKTAAGNLSVFCAADRQAVDLPQLDATMNGLGQNYSLSDNSHEDMLFEFEDQAFKYREESENVEIPATDEMMLFTS